MTNPEQNAGIPEIVEGHHIAGPVGGVATGTEAQVEPAAPKPKRVAVPPDLIGGPLSSENAAWLGEHIQNERHHKRAVAVRTAERNRNKPGNRRARQHFV